MIIVKRSSTTADGGIRAVEPKTQFLYLGLKEAWQSAPYFGNCLSVKNKKEVQINHQADSVADKLNTHN